MARRKNKRIGSYKGKQNAVTLKPSSRATVARATESDTMTQLSQVSVERAFIGPIPPPDAFARYEKTLPGAADRILSLAEKEQQNRAAENQTNLNHERKLIHSATSVSILLLAIAGVALWKDALVPAIIFGTIGTVNSIFRHLLDRRQATRK